MYHYWIILFYERNLRIRAYFTLFISKFFKKKQTNKLPEMQLTPQKHC